MPPGFECPEQPPAISVEELKRTFSQKVADHILNPRNMGEVHIPDGLGSASRSCGDSMQISLRITQDRILEARFMTEGCGPVIACGSMVTELVKGKTIDEALALSEDDIMMGLGGLPESETHCATLAIGALRHALADSFALRREPWKKAYRRTMPLEPGR